LISVPIESMIALDKRVEDAMTRAVTGYVYAALFATALIAGGLAGRFFF